MNDRELPDAYSFEALEAAYRAGFDHGEIAARASIRDDPEATINEGFFDWMTREHVRPLREGS